VIDRLHLEYEHGEEGSLSLPCLLITFAQSELVYADEQVHDVDRRSDTVRAMGRFGFLGPKGGRNVGLGGGRSRSSPYGAAQLMPLWFQRQRPQTPHITPPMIAPGT